MVCASGFFAVNRYEWLYEMLRVFVMLVFLFIVITLADDRVYPVMTFLALGLSLFGLVKICTAEINGFGINGLGGNQNQWAHLLVLLVPFCWKHKVVVFLLLLNILFTRNRGAFAAFGLMAIILSEGKMRYAVMGVVVSVIVFFLIFNRALLLSPQRFGVWKATLAMFAAEPLGIGAGNWRLIIPKYRQYFIEPNIFNPLFYNRPHNDYLLVLSEMGIGGFLCYIGFLIYLLFKSFKNKVLFAGIVGFMVISFLSFPMERAAISFVFLLTAGLALNGKFKPLKFQLWPIAICILIFASGDFWLRYKGSCQALASRASKDISDMRISKFACIDETTTPLYLFRGLRRYELKDYAGAFGDFETASKMAPNHPYVLAVFGSTLMNIGRPNEARPYIEKSLSVTPELELAQTVMERLK